MGHKMQDTTVSSPIGIPPVQIDVTPVTSYLEGKMDALEFLGSVYQNVTVPLPVRMRAAQIAVEYERPRLAVTALVDGEDFAARLERAIERSALADAPTNGMKLIEAKPTKLRRL